MRCTGWGMPQWSLPVNGGSTGRLIDRLLDRWPPQWSPPVNGGSTCNTRYREARQAYAAMEPAGERREHPAAGCYVSISAFGPQWSPPVNGGSTAYRFRAV